MDVGQTLPVLIVAARNRHCALRMSDVIDTMQPLPVVPLPQMPSFMHGLAVICGAMTPVLDLGRLIGSNDETSATRFVIVRADGRPVALTVDSIVGGRWLKPQSFDQLPPLLGDTQHGVITALGALHQNLLLLLQATRLLSEEMRQRLQVVPAEAANDCLGQLATK